MIGFIDVSTEQRKRIFITYEQVMGAQWRYDPKMCNESTWRIKKLISLLISEVIPIYHVV
ncbi:MAG: hypothetical protein WKG06_23450 [Segetibacter sp.]